MRMIRNNPDATGGLTPRRRGPIPHRTPTLAQVTDGALIDAPWPPRVVDGKMTRRQLAQVALGLPQVSTARSRRLEREAMAERLRDHWRTA